jgi:hypothetical protein
VGASRLFQMHCASSFYSYTYSKVQHFEQSAALCLMGLRGGHSALFDLTQWNGVSGDEILIQLESHNYTGREGIYHPCHDTLHTQDYLPVLVSIGVASTSDTVL